MTAEAEIRRRIHQQGAITLAEFMDVALYWHDGGYYTTTEPFGASGDYYTSPMAHPAFGALLAVQLFQMWQLLGSPNTFTVVEMGAGNGLLCRDIIAYSSHISEEFQSSLRYVCLDRRLAVGEERNSNRAFRVASAGIPMKGVIGCFLSNEFLDAFPVHQVRVDGGRLKEVYVALDGDNLVETLGELSTPRLLDRLKGLNIDLAEGQTAEINLGLDGWAEAVSTALDAGFVLSIDYGHPASELYAAKVRPRGTLTTYYRHIQMDAPFRRIGQQDISAQVDFTAVAKAGEDLGLDTLGSTTQGHFLNNLGLGRFRSGLASLGLPPAALQANRAGLVDLVRPAGLGDFKVLVQGKNVGRPSLWGFEPAEGLLELIERLDLPLLTPQHISQLEGRYPPVEYELALGDLWPWGNESPEDDSPSSR
ncbi:MAG: SAM-dependent methyltransferase [Chloroflexi bacterium]|nr:SAM-dependent methyltransferase [Chloroflexota bacterium]MDA1219812.1 SAM-dependent methyltransferase [Chloroflexota bacterium]